MILSVCYGWLFWIEAETRCCWNVAVRLLMSLLSSNHLYLTIQFKFSTGKRWLIDYILEKIPELSISSPEKEREKVTKEVKVWNSVNVKSEKKETENAFRKSADDALFETQYWSLLSFESEHEPNLFIFFTKIFCINFFTRYDIWKEGRVADPGWLTALTVNKKYPLRSPHTKMRRSRFFLTSHAISRWPGLIHID